ncbi:MAG TPA: ribosome biogenesis factor YjgA [Dokdonella sp.]
MHDPTQDDDAQDGARGPSRSELRRGALDVLRLAETLASMSDAELARLALDDELHEEIARTRAVTSHIARKRQLQFLAKQMRKLDEATLERIRRALAHDRDEARREAAALHHVERWRERLLDGGDDALTAFVAEYAEIDRQRLRQLVRNALAERAAGKPPHAFRELFRTLRETMIRGDAAPE